MQFPRLQIGFKKCLGLIKTWKAPLCKTSHLFQLISTSPRCRALMWSLFCSLFSPTAGCLEGEKKGRKCTVPSSPDKKSFWHKLLLYSLDVRVMWINFRSWYAALIISINKKQYRKQSFVNLHLQRMRTMHITDEGIRGLTKTLTRLLPLCFGIHVHISLGGQLRKPHH